jgi:acyl-CoA dehydrogenase
MTTAPADGMPSTRGTNCSLADPNLAFVCASVMPADDLARARPHLIAMGEVAGGELDALAAVADRHPPVLRAYDETGRRVDDIIRHPAYRARERIAFERFGLAALSRRAGVLGWPGRVPHVVKYAPSYLFSRAEFGLLWQVARLQLVAGEASQHARRRVGQRRRPSARGCRRWSTGRPCPPRRWRSPPEAAEIPSRRELPSSRAV